jgi:NADH:ubiquinone oxidoreductase subunit 4 (subunit M)
LLWPQIGLALLSWMAVTPPAWLLPWALSTSALYAFRALALREVGQWTGFLATSLWALLWVWVVGDSKSSPAGLHALGFSVPLVLLAMLAAGLERRFGAAFTGLYSGLAQTLPRLSGALVMVVLAAVATPLFSPFFSVLGIIVDTADGMPGAALAVLGIWLLWSWAGIRLLQGLVIGPAGSSESDDLTLASAWGYAIALALLIVGGIHLTGDLT